MDAERGRGVGLGRDDLEGSAGSAHGRLEGFEKQ
jgi:hypothetical protein